MISPNHSENWAGRRILFLLRWLELGGAESQALLLAKHLKQSLGAEVEIWGFEPPGRVAQICANLGIPCRQMTFSFDRGRINKSANLIRHAYKLREFRPDLLLPYTMDPNLLAGFLWRFVGARGCVWQQRDEGRMRRPGFFENRALAGSSIFIANSTASRDFLQNTLAVPAHRIKVIMNGVHVSVSPRESNAWRSRLSVDDRTLLVCMVANLHDYKDHETLLRAWRIVVDESRNHNQEPVLLLAGRFGSTHYELKALAFDLDLGRHVRFLGSVDNVAELLASVDLGVFSSRYEGCPNGVLECMASELPVVATDIPGTRDALGEEGLPMLTAPGNHDALATKILLLLNNPALREQEGRRNRRRVAEFFSVERMCKETTNVITAVLDRKRSGANLNLVTDEDIIVKGSSTVRRTTA